MTDKELNEKLVSERVLGALLEHIEQQNARDAIKLRILLLLIVAMVLLGFVLSLVQQQQGPVSEPVVDPNLVTAILYEKPLDGDMPDAFRVQITREFRAICLWEGRGKIDLNAYNESEDARGPAQIRPGYLQDANEWLEARRHATFTHEDMHNYGDALQVYIVYMLRHKGTTTEKRVRMHNGGPDGHLQDCTLEYWKGVQQYL